MAEGRTRDDDLRSARLEGHWETPAELAEKLALFRAAMPDGTVILRMTPERRDAVLAVLRRGLAPEPPAPPGFRQRLAAWWRAKVAFHG